MMMCALSYSLKFPWLPTNQPGRQPANRPYTLCVLSFSAFFSQGNNSILATQMRQQKSLVVVVIVIIERTRLALTSRIKADAEFSDNFVCIIRFFHKDLVIYAGNHHEGNVQHILLIHGARSVNLGELW